MRHACRDAGLPDARSIREGSGPCALSMRWPLRALPSSCRGAGSAAALAPWCAPFLSPHRSLTPLHYDGHHNLFLQLAGAKRFLLLPPEATPLLYPFPRLHPLWHKSRADFEAPVAVCGEGITAAGMLAAVLAECLKVGPLRGRQAAAAQNRRCCTAP